MKTISLLLTTCMLFVTGLSHAEVGLYNTGVDNSNVVLAVGATDTHYTVSPGSQAFATQYPEGYGAGYWLAPSSTSSWITPLLGAGNTASGAAGSNYTFQTTFDLTGINLTTAVINGQVTADNGITDILINGHSTGFVYGSPWTGTYSTFANFTVNNFFQTGLNTLSFDVVSGAGPVGFRAEYSGSSLTAAVTPAVPEPETYAMLLAGLGLIGFTARRKKQNA